MAAYCTTAIYGNWSHLTGGRPIVEVLERLQVRAVQCTVERVNVWRTSMKFALGLRKSKQFRDLVKIHWRLRI